MANEWEEHRERFDAERPETFEAYVDVWTRDADAPRKFVDWPTFARCADADLAMLRKAPDLVREAEALMARNGYRLGPVAGSAGRRWHHTRGEVRTTSERPVRATRASASRRSATARPSSARPAAPRRTTAPPKPAPRPTHVECPHDPGMMVPLEGSCICGWSPRDDA